MMEQGSRNTRRLPARECKHDYPTMVTTSDSGRYATCLRCKAVGQLRETSEEARNALLVNARSRNAEENGLRAE